MTTVLYINVQFVQPVCCCLVQGKKVTIALCVRAEVYNMFCRLLGFTTSACCLGIYNKQSAIMYVTSDLLQYLNCLWSYGLNYFKTILSEPVIKYNCSRSNTRLEHVCNKNNGGAMIWQHEHQIVLSQLQQKCNRRRKMASCWE